MCEVGAINRRDQAVFPLPFALRKRSEPSEAVFGTVIACCSVTDGFLSAGSVIVVASGEWRLSTLRLESPALAGDSRSGFRTAGLPVGAPHARRDANRL